jgi:hypothetical protein
VILGGGYAWLRYRIADICYGGGAAKEPGKYISHLNDLSGLLLWAGIAVAAFALLGVLAAGLAQAILQKTHYPRFKLGVSTCTTTFGLAAAAALPVLCMIAWLVSDRHLGDPTTSMKCEARQELTH